EAESETTELLPLQISEADFNSPLPSKIAFSSAVGSGAVVSLGDKAIHERVNRILEDGLVPKAIHDLKSALHHFSAVGIDVAGVRHDPMLYSYLINPTYSSHALPEAVLRRFNVKMSGHLAEAADLTRQLSVALREEVEEEKLLPVYEEIDAPLVPVLAR